MVSGTAGHTTGGRLIGGAETMAIAHGKTEGEGGTETEDMKVKAMASTEDMKVEAMAGVEAMAEGEI